MRSVVGGIAVNDRLIRSVVRPPSRRTFVKGLALGGAALGLGAFRVSPGYAQAEARRNPAILTGTQFDLRIGPMPINITGNPKAALAINGSVPAPTLRWKEGDTVTMRVANALNEDASIHWHGMLLPANMDGVPGLSFPGIAPRDSYTYQFTVRQNGTYWYHSHSGFQEQAGMYGAIVIDPLEPEPFSYDRDYVVLLSDWTDLDPAALFARLKKMSGHDRAAALPPPGGHATHDNSIQRYLLVDQLEAWNADPGTGLQWEGQGWVGTDLNRLWLRSEGERVDGRTDSADLEVLYGRSIAPWWDVVAGVRHDFKPGAAQDFAALGVMQRRRTHR